VALAAGLGVWTWSYASTLLHMRVWRAKVTAVGLGLIAIISAMLWWRLVNTRLRLEDTRFVLAIRGRTYVVPWTDVSRVTEHLSRRRLIAVVLTMPQGELRLPKQLHPFDSILAELHARVPDERWTQTTILR